MMTHQPSWPECSSPLFRGDEAQARVFLAAPVSGLDDLALSRHFLAEPSTGAARGARAYVDHCPGCSTLLPPCSPRLDSGASRSPNPNHSSMTPPLRTEPALTSGVILT